MRRHCQDAPCCAFGWNRKADLESRERPEAKPSPIFALGGKERFEDANSYVGRNSAAAVGECDAKPIDAGPLLQSADCLTRRTNRPLIGTASIALISRVEKICRIWPG